MSAGKLFLLDAMALLYRAHFVFINNPRRTSTGLDTSAVYGFTNTLIEVLEKERPTHLGVVFDAEGPTFRNEQYADYKGHRPPPPKELTEAIPMTHRLLQALRIPVLVLPGYEADDLLATLAREAALADFDVFLMTPDKDCAQLVTERVRLYVPGTKGKPAEVLGPAEVTEKFGVGPEYITDLLGLKGDSVDNIPGIPKVGDKTAVQLIQQFGTLEQVLARTAEVTKPALRQSLEQFADQGRLSKQLAVLDVHAPVAFDAQALAVEPPDAPALTALFQELEFRTLGRRLGLTEPAQPPAATPGTGQGSLDFGLTPATLADDVPSVHTSLKTLADVPHDYRLAETDAELQDLIDDLGTHTAWAFDSETTGLDPLEAELVALTFCARPGRAWYVPFPSDQAEAQRRLRLLAPLFMSEGVTKSAHNLKYDLTVLKRYGLEPVGPLYDTMLAHYAARAEGKHGLDALAEQYLAYRPISIETLIGPKGKGQKTMRQAPQEELLNYAAEDADIALQLYQVLQPVVEQGGATRLLQEVELPLVPILRDMEWEGVRVDTAFLGAYAKELDHELRTLERELYLLAGTEFNLNSPKQLGEVLFERLKLGGAKPKKTATGQYATDEETLSRLAGEHQLPATILLYRQLTKLKSTYVDALPTLVNPRTGRVHTTFNQAVAVTGRLSSQNPNLQNIPIRTDRGREVRKAFVARQPGWVLFSADYSQIELRLMAHFSEDPALIEAFQQGQDIHVATAAGIFGVKPEEVDGEMRRRAKTANFGIIYGITAFGLAQRLGIVRTEAKEFIEGYFRQYPGVKAFMEGAISRARDRGYTETLMGRRQYLPALTSLNPTQRGFAERNAINTPLQGSAAELIKLAMAAIHPQLKAQGLQARMTLQVHDELLFDVPEEEVDALRTLVTRAMRSALSLRVPLEVGTGTGPNWLDAH